MSDVIDNQKENRFELSVDGSLAIAEYRISGDTIYFTHTETPWALQGRGVASKLIHAALTSARDRGLKVIVAGAGGAAHLPGMAASMTTLPVFGVPIESKALKGMDSLLSIVQMPGGVPVGTLAIGKAGAINAALLAASILSLGDPETVLSIVESEVGGRSTTLLQV